MFWRIHKTIFQNRLKEACNILIATGDKIQIIEQQDIEFTLFPNDFDKTKPAFAITTIQDANRLIKTDTGINICYDKQNYKVSTWISYLQELEVLNNDCYFLPLSLIIHLDSNKFPIFIKPDSGDKLFTGFIAHNPDDILSHPDIAFYMVNAPETMCMIANPKEISDIEWRLWIIDRKISGYSPYSWNKKILLSDPPLEIIELAEKVINIEWQPNSIYTIDIANEMNNKQPKIVEINAGSTSGFYNADLYKILSDIRNSILNNNIRPCGEDIYEYYCEDAGDCIHALCGECDCESFFDDNESLSTE